MQKNEILEAIERNVVLGHLDQGDDGFDGDMEGENGVSELVAAAMAASIPGREVVASLTAGMAEVGRRYESGEYMIPDMLASAECVGVAMDRLSGYLQQDDLQNREQIVLATVEGDLHDIGKNIVATMLKGAGYQVHDLGINVPADEIVAAVESTGAKYLGLSALLTTTMVKMGDVVEKLQGAGLRDRVKVLVGGAPTSPEFAMRVGADAHGRDGFDAIEKLRQLAEA